ncbi:TetR/AcrR family transcriptional regulator [Mycoplasmatota bacterium]|nr:TetR/AcrR family transcriptional regulator [Mycoplasmatota bacterium]
MNKKRKIIYSFMELIKDKGSVSDVTIKEVAAKAGIGKGTIYEYFSSKDEIVTSVIDYVIGSMMEAFLINEGYQNLSYEESLRRYIENIAIGSRKVSEIIAVQESLIPGNLKLIDVKKIIFEKLIDFQKQNLGIFKENVYDKGRQEGVVELIDDYYLIIILKTIVRELKELNHLKYNSMHEDELKEKLFKITLKILKAE